MSFCLRVAHRLVEYLVAKELCCINSRTRMIANQSAITQSVGFLVSGFQVISCCTRDFKPSEPSLDGSSIKLLS